MPGKKKKKAKFRILCKGGSAQCETWMAGMWGHQGELTFKRRQEGGVKWGGGAFSKKKKTVVKTSRYNSQRSVSGRPDKTKGGGGGDREGPVRSREALKKPNVMANAS